MENNFIKYLPQRFKSLGIKVTFSRENIIVTGDADVTTARVVIQF